MPHTIKGKKPLLARVRRIKGQAAALEKALEEEADCSAVLQQIAAIRGAVNGLMAEVLEGHLREHLNADDLPRQQRLDLLPQRLRAPLQVPLARGVRPSRRCHRLGASIVPRQPAVPHRHSNCFFSFFV